MEMHDFSTSVSLMFGAGFFVVGGCRMHCKMFSIIPDLYIICASSTYHPKIPKTKKKSLQILPHVPLKDKILLCLCRTSGLVNEQGGELFYMK